MANEYASPTELKDALTLTGETFADTQIGFALEAASRAIDKHCGQRFYLDTDANQARFYTPRDECRIEFDVPLNTLTSVCTDLDGDGTYETVWLATDYILGPFNALLDGMPYRWLMVNEVTGGQRFPCWQRSLRIVGRFGWAAVPPAVKEATLISAARLLTRARQAPLGVVGFGLDGGVAQVTSVDPDVQMLLAPFKYQSIVVA